MVDITLFTETVRCHMCDQVDMYNGLKRRNNFWYCKACLDKMDRVDVPPEVKVN